MKQELIEKARKIISSEDPSHDIDHALRVLANAEYIARAEGGDMDIIIPAALFHDAVTYPKNNSMSRHAARHSADAARKILEELGYCGEKIKKVEQAILEHPYNDGIRPDSAESKIVQDADRLEATGAISIMRTFCSTGQMKRKFYSPNDPFCEGREADSMIYALDLFYKRLLKVKDLMNTEIGRKLANKRTKFLHAFLCQLKEELTATGMRLGYY